MRLVYLLIILAMVSFAGYEYNRIERHYAFVEERAMYIFEHCESFK